MRAYFFLCWTLVKEIKLSYYVQYHKNFWVESKLFRILHFKFFFFFNAKLADLSTDVIAVSELELRFGMR